MKPGLFDQYHQITYSQQFVALNSIKRLFLNIAVRYGIPVLQNCNWKIERLQKNA